ncbi:MAG: hypothetical protein FWF57_10380 [Defluviitaleaceae bacterium]|nr:hypothetical protein [Defluviitaleaceae bacterium]
MKVEIYENENKFLTAVENILQDTEGIEKFPILDIDSKFFNKYNNYFYDFDIKDINQNMYKQRNLLIVYNAKKISILIDFAAKIFNAIIIEVSHLKEVENHLKKINPDFTYLFIDTDFFNHNIFDEFQNYVSNNYESGVITARNLSSLSWILLKSLLEYPTENYLTLLPRETREFNKNSWIKLTQKSKMLNELKDIFAEDNNVDVFSISSHGTEDCISLSDGIICGKSCDFVNGLTCIPGERCPVNKNSFMSFLIKSKIIFNNTCLGFRLNSTILPIESNITTNFFEGFPKVYVSSNTVKYGPDSEVCLFVNLIKYGYSVGKAVKILNNILKNSDFDINTFFILGDPNTFGSQIEELSIFYLDDIYNEFIVSTKNKSFFEVIVDEFTYNIVESIWIKSKQEIYFSKYYDNRNNIYKILIYSWDNFENDNLAINFITKEVVKILYFELPLENWILGLERYITGKNIHNRFTSLHSMLDKLAKLFEKMNYDTTAYNRALNQKIKIEEEISNIQKELVEKLLVKSTTDTSVWLPDAYLDVSKIIRNKNQKIECFICSSLSELITFQHRITKTQRQALYCPRCGCVYDYPYQSCIEMTIEGLCETSNNGEFIQTLRIKNNSNQKYIGFGGIRIDSSKKYDLIYNPSILKIDLESNEEKTYKIKITLNTKFEPHLYYIKGFAVLNLNLYYNNKPVFIKGGD